MITGIIIGLGFGFAIGLGVALWVGMRLSSDMHKLITILEDDLHD